MNVLLSETDWTHIENILGGFAVFIGVMTWVAWMWWLSR